MGSCGVPNCRNRSIDKNKNRSYHRLPPESKPELRKKWLHFLKRKDMPTNLKFCSDHFEEDCFKRDLQAELMGIKRRRILKENAVPTLFFYDHTGIKEDLLPNLQKIQKKDQDIKTNLKEQTQKVDVGCSTHDLVAHIHKKVNTISPKTRSIRTQYNIKDTLKNAEKFTYENSCPTMVNITRPR